MKSLKQYYEDLSESYVQRNGNKITVGSLRLQFYHDHVFYTIGNGSEVDLSIYKDGGFKPPRNNEIFAADARANGVPQDLVTIITTWLNTPKDKQEELMPKVVKALEYFVQKHLDKRATKEAQYSEVDAMKKPKITTEVDLEETEGLFNSTADRWSRRAKHHLSRTELQSAADYSDFAKGETAVYEGQEVEIRIPIGPNGTTGIMLEGHLKMVKRTTLEKLDENYSLVSGVTPLGPINRIMQLAGLEHSGAVVETDTIDQSINEEMFAEDASTMFNQLLTTNNNTKYRNNPTAATLATLGQVLGGLQKLISQLPEDLPHDVANHIKTVPGIGVELIKAADNMIKPVSGQK